MKNTLESYNKSAAVYDEKFADYTPYQRQIEKFITFLKPKSNILDMGCGTGINSSSFLSAGHRVHGFDFSKSMIEIAEKNCPDGNFKISTIQDYNPQQKFDAICLSFIIVHLIDADVKNLINSLKNLVNINGYIYLSFMTGKDAGTEVTSFSSTEIFFNYFKTTEIIELFNRNGFSLEYSSIEPYSEPDGSITEDVFLTFQL